MQEGRTEKKEGSEGRKEEEMEKYTLEFVNYSYFVKFFFYSVHWPFSVVIPYNNLYPTPPLTRGARRVVTSSSIFYIFFQFYFFIFFLPFFLVKPPF